MIANFGDVISLGPGTFFEHDLVWPSGVRLVSASGDPATTILDAEGLGRCLDVSATGPETVFRGITFTNGVSATDGGLVMADGSLGRFRDCVFRNGSAVRGGAIFLSSAGLDACEFRENEARRGGAVFCAKREGEEASTLSRCVFEGNTASVSGGAVHSEGEQGFADGLYLLSSTFLANSARNGGAARLHEFDTVQGCRFLDNVATASGGALYLVATTPNEHLQGIQTTVFARNVAAIGGGIAVEDGFPIPNVVFIANTMIENHAPTGAHLAFLGHGSGFFLRSILAFGRGGEAVAGNWPIGVSCFDVFENAGGDWVGPLAGQLGADGNACADPRFLDPGSDDFRLAEGSPCLPPLPSGCGDGIGALPVDSPPVSVRALARAAFGRHR
jgi:predicted outer membrane repeat protein